MSMNVTCPECDKRFTVSGNVDIRRCTEHVQAGLVPTEGLYPDPFPRSSGFLGANYDGAACERMYRATNGRR